MADLRISPEELQPLVRQIVEAVLAETRRQEQFLNGKLAVPEAEAAALLALNPWQLRDLRLAGKINHSRIVGGRVRYTADDLLDYLRHHHEAGTGKGR
jgi:hypothetical protein